ncbi:hypothetical protein Patl1_06950 [Pistacia atlantica]|uniref:Uncharacterized protein n=1 Tax=Pistacia atlantica TaxID=434234 RepID=A0ACC1AES0_9ROSI|nr:hypothetical protein Patl1_06950 [Pistacia atlantica]
MMTLLASGTDTTSVTADWAMSLLLNHPLVLKRARAELDCHVGHDHLAEEPDLVKLPYLQHIINETFWLFLVAPLLVPHESSNYCTIGRTLKVLDQRGLKDWKMKLRHITSYHLVEEEDPALELALPIE